MEHIGLVLWQKIIKMGGEPRSRASPVNFTLLHSPLRSSDHTCHFQPHSHLALNEPDALQVFPYEYCCFQILPVDPCTLSSLEPLGTCRTPSTNVSHALSLINRTRQQCLRGIEFKLLPWGPRDISSTMSCCPAIAVGAGIHGPICRYAAAGLPAGARTNLFQLGLC